MSNSIQNVNKINAGTCPHGCAPSACPICSGMGSGGLRAGERIKKPGELSYHECAMLGAMMRAKAAAAEEHEKTLANNAQVAKNFEEHLTQISEKLSQLAAQLSRSIMSKPLAAILNVIVIPITNGIRNMVVNIQNFINKLTQIKIDIQDKLNAIFGELKAFIEKKVSELITNIKTKIVSLFKIFKRNNTKDDETKIDEDKKIFRLKTFINRLFKRKDDTENKSGS